MPKQRVRVKDGVSVRLDHGEGDWGKCEVFADRCIDDQRVHAVVRALNHGWPATTFGGPKRGSSRLGTPVVMPW